MKTALITDQHLEHREWLNRLAFYNDEIKIMQNRIAEVATKNNGQEVMIQVEHFQNQLIIQSSTIDQLNHDIKKHEQIISAEAEKNPVASDHRRTEIHPAHKEDIATFEKIFNELRHELIYWLSKVL
jgi:hypothetical protein